MDTYRYALVRVKGFSQGYSYISDDPALTEGSYVLVPFGDSNQEQAGVVLHICECTADNAPFPVERTKHIIRRISRREYAAAADFPFRKSKEQADLEERLHMEWYLDHHEAYEYEYCHLYEWACRHQENASPQMIRLVIRCYELCAARHMPEACLNLGTFYYNGIFVEQDYKKAAALYQIAADHGLGEGIRNLGYCYYYGRHQAADYEKAWSYFSKGALLFGDANCMYKLGDMYRLGQGVKRSGDFAWKMYNRARKEAEENDQYQFCLGDIYSRIGLCLLQGIGIPQDVEAAHRFLQTALDALYARRKTDPCVGGPIARTRKQIRLAESILDRDILRR